jgi:hypothetical protein
VSSRLSRSPKIEGLCSKWAECEDELEESEVPEDGEEIEEREEGDEDESELGWARLGASELGRSSRNCVARCRL